MEEDTEFWRRLYYALFLRTRLSDEALAELGATRPPPGLTFSPRVEARRAQRPRPLRPRRQAPTLRPR